MKLVAKYKQEVMNLRKEAEMHKKCSLGANLMANKLDALIRVHMSLDTLRKAARHLNLKTGGYKELKTQCETPTLADKFEEGEDEDEPAA